MYMYCTLNAHMYTGSIVYMEREEDVRRGKNRETPLLKTRSLALYTRFLLFVYIDVCEPVYTCI